MKFSIVTPSYNSVDFLPQCCASVADQQAGGVDVEHLIVDGGSNDETSQWLRRHEDAMDFSWTSEPDDGMYDALNKGFDRATGEYFAWLNADEQYLPQVLRCVEAAFEESPACDIICSDALVVDEDNRLICMRRGEPLRAAYIVNEGMHSLTCSMFFRRRIWDKGLRFNPGLKSVGENDFFLNALRAGARTRYIHVSTSAFTKTDSNLGASDLSKKEFAIFRHEHKRWYLNPVVSKGLTLARRLEKACRGAYAKVENMEYELYSQSCGTVRQKYLSPKSTYKWPR